MKKPGYPGFSICLNRMRAGAVSEYGLRGVPSTIMLLLSSLSSTPSIVSGAPAFLSKKEKHDPWN
jgi:hypothetical protein